MFDRKRPILGRRRDPRDTPRVRAPELSTETLVRRNGLLTDIGYRLLAPAPKRNGDSTPFGYRGTQQEPGTVIEDRAAVRP
jgi:hypothetical protein